MSQAFFCDKCGASNAEPQRLYLKTKSSASMGRWYDLCESCRRQVLALLEERP